MAYQTLLTQLHHQRRRGPSAEHPAVSGLHRLCARGQREEDRQEHSPIQVRDRRASAQSSKHSACMFPISRAPSLLAICLTPRNALLQHPVDLEDPRAP